MTDLIALATILATDAATVRPSVVVALIMPDTPERVATRLRSIACDYPGGVPIELLDLERRREVERLHMVGDGLD